MRDRLGQESCRTKVSRIFRIFVPNFAPNFAPNFPRIFRGFFVLRFVGDGDQKKFTKNPRHFSMQNSQANTKKIFTKFFWRAGKVTIEAAILNRVLDRDWTLNRCAPLRLCLFWLLIWEGDEQKTILVFRVLCFAEFSKQGSTPTPWARGLRDQIQKWALQTQKTLYF